MIKKLIIKLNFLKTVNLFSILTYYVVIIVITVNEGLNPPLKNSF